MSLFRRLGRWLMFRLWQAVELVFWTIYYALWVLGQILLHLLQRCITTASRFRR